MHMLKVRDEMRSIFFWETMKMVIINTNCYVTSNFDKKKIFYFHLLQKCFAAQIP